MYDYRGDEDDPRRWSHLNTATRPDHVDEPHYPEDDTRHLYFGDRSPGWQGGKLRHEVARG